MYFETYLDSAIRIDNDNFKIAGYNLLRAFPTGFELGKKSRFAK